MAVVDFPFEGVDSLNLEFIIRDDSFATFSSTAESGSAAKAFLIFL